ncbi:maleylpyruvate isomerase N-terminal domain-containing protein [Nocardioides sp. LS1]|uniref:maleylpyruvate isomerase N-terminal domain-containing protein n=1 Tax=Nocardioides sp. LS1 TaxID=1027620 RepID=UPI000FF92C2E|nr:maleylpyruvate isomerase N-terminal domain-containing protein [Nocardioides sp. LS1]GCD90285.1 hypothetical protein NLS1_22910 [Nocardioides sp. LS1]
MTDWGQLYRDNVRAVAALAADLDEERLGRTVPATPAWTVRDVYAHLAGGPADAVSGRMEGAPGPEWTARHVGERQAVPLADLVAEMQANAGAVAATTVDNPRPALVWDISVHHADLHEALDLGRLPDPLWSPVLEAIAPRMLGEEYDTIDVPAYELYRGFFSRRSRTQMRAWGTPLGDERLDGLCIFGPREDDQPIPA